MQRLAFLPSLLLLSLASQGCSAEKPAAGAKAASAAAADVSPAEGAVAKAGPPKIISDQPVFDFGKVKPKGTVEHVFTIKNGGGSDLHIKGVQKT